MSVSVYTNPEDAYYSDFLGGDQWLHGYYAGVLGLVSACGPAEYLLGYKRGQADRLGEGESND